VGDNRQPGQALTQGAERIQCAAAGGGAAPGADEAEIDAFIETLARIAHAVTARNTRQDQQEETGQ
jgi:hypothetical protein